MGELEAGDIPEIIFVAGFDALLLAFEKKDNPFFDPKHIRDIYTLTGIVKPVIMINGELVATWRKDKDKIYVCPFKDLSKKAMRLIECVRVEEFQEVSELLFE